MRFENLVEMLEKLGFEYIEDYEGDWVVFRNGNKFVCIDSEDENKFKVVDREEDI